MLIDKFLEYHEPIQYNIIKNNIKQVVIDALDDFMLDKPMFSPEDFDVYFYDDYVMSTNVTKQNIYRVFVRINQSRNMKPMQSKTLITQSGEVKVTKSKVPELFLSLEKVKKDLFDKLRMYFDESVVFWHEKYSIMIQGKEEVEEGVIQPYIIEVIPCVYYVNDDGVRGIMYYDDSKQDIQIEYHERALTNYLQKVQETNMLYYYYILLFKNIFNITEKEKRLPYEIYETILYNVPNEMFIDLSKDTALKIIHYLLHKDIGIMKGLDDIENAFTSKYRAMSYLYAKRAIKTIADNIKMINFK